MIVFDRRRPAQLVPRPVPISIRAGVTSGMETLDIIACAGVPMDTLVLPYNEPL
jgi:hypothetical protein